MVFWLGNTDRMNICCLGGEDGLIVLENNGRGYISTLTYLMNLLLCSSMDWISKISIINRLNINAVKFKQLIYQSTDRRSKHSRVNRKNQWFMDGMVLHEYIFMFIHPKKPQYLLGNYLIKVYSYHNEWIDDKKNSESYITRVKNDADLSFWSLCLLADLDLPLFNSKSNYIL